jgi:hypothetical protein
MLLHTLISELMTMDEGLYRSITLEDFHDCLTLIACLAQRRNPHRRLL